MSPIQVLQNKTLKIINATYWHDHITTNSLLYKYGLLSIADLHRYELGKLMHLYHYDTFPDMFKNYFLPLQQAHNHCTKNKTKQNYFMMSVRTNAAKNSLRFLGAHLWNQIPCELKEYSHYRFEKEYKKQLLKIYNT